MNVTIHKAQADEQTLCFHYGDELICFKRLSRHSGIERVLVKVHPDCRVEVAAPVEASNDDILNAVKKRGRWIYQQLSNFRAQLEHVTSRAYISGESHYYLGRQYVLKITEATDQNQHVKLLRGKLDVSVRQHDPEKVRLLLNGWYKTRAKEVFRHRLDAMLEQALWVDTPPPLRLLTMQTQWGSCSPQGRLTLNPHLVKAPRDCIDYVILHELCHIAEHNHSERFYRLMNQVMPEWQKTKEHLDRMAHLIFA